MADYTAYAGLQGAPGDPLKAEDWNALCENADAIAEGASGAPGVSVENALSTTETDQGKVLRPDGSGAVEWGSGVSSATGTVQGDGASTVTIPVTLDTDAGSQYEFTIAKTTDVDGTTGMCAHGFAFRYKNNSGTDTWLIDLDTTFTIGFTGATVNGSNQIALINFDDADTYRYCVRTLTTG